MHKLQWKLMDKKKIDKNEFDPAVEKLLHVLYVESKGHFPHAYDRIMCLFGKFNGVTAHVASTVSNLLTKEGCETEEEARKKLKQHLEEDPDYLICPYDRLKK